MKWRRWMLAGFFVCCSVFFADSASWAGSLGEAPPPAASPSASVSSEPSQPPVEPEPEPSSPGPSPSPPSSTSDSHAGEPSPDSSQPGEPESAAMMSETTETGATVVTLDTHDAAFFTLALGIIACCSVASLIVSFGRGGS